MQSLSNILYWLSTGLFVPVMLGTVIMFIYSLVLLGFFYSNYKDYLRYQRKLRTELLKNNSYSKEFVSNCPKEIRYTVSEIITHKYSKADMERVLSEFELKSDKILGSYKTLAKLGPILGLMGTLIPMGPALAGLGQGDVSSMSWNMQVAFSTTVIGLFAGTLGFLMVQPKQRILMYYLTDLEFIVNRFSEPLPDTLKNEIIQHQLQSIQ